MPIIPIAGWRQIYQEFLADLLSRVPLRRITLGSICSYPQAMRLTERKLGRENLISVQLAQSRLPDGRARFPIPHPTNESTQHASAAISSLVRDLVQRSLRQGAPILVPTNEQAETVNDLCQQARLKAGVLSRTKSAKIIDEDESRDITYRSRVYQGDRVVFTRNDRRMDVQNGFTGTIIGISPFGRSISVRLDNGRRVIIPVKEYKHLRRGYGIVPSP
ncbi:MAG: hypothetical protein HQ582_16095 [Planctomycetes bacterium]|nr:hypothetical protein [Planctomycetota bacterium]